MTGSVAGRSGRFSAWAAAAAAFAGILATGGCAREIRDTDIKLIPIAVVKDRIDKQARGESGLILVIDPRPVKDFEKAHIPGARSITLHQITPRSKVDPAIDQFKTIVVYGDDPASAVARGMTKRLMGVGYDGVRLFAGGLAEWTGRGYLVEGKAPDTPAPPAAGTTPAPPPAPSASAPPGH